MHSQKQCTYTFVKTEEVMKNGQSKKKQTNKKPGHNGPHTPTHTYIYRHQAKQTKEHNTVNYKRL